MASERHPCQVVKLTLPKCVNTHGSAPCTATQTGNGKCFNTFSTCNDPANYRETPDGHLDADLTKIDGDTIASTELTLNADLFAAFDVSFADDPSGTIWEQGGSADDAAYLGITSNNLVFRAGGGDAADPTDCAKITYADSNVAGKTFTLYVEIDVSAGSVTLWGFDKVALTLTQFGTDTASAGFTASTWAGTDGGAIGQDGGSNIATGETGGDFNGLITGARFYDSTAAPSMSSDDYRQLVYFGRAQQSRPADDIKVWPLINSVSTNGSRINLASGDVNYEPLGGRATMQVTFGDSPSSDRGIDPYLSDRSGDPLDYGTFWTKFRVREKVGRQGAEVVLYEGYAGEKLADMQARAYLVDRVDFGGVDSVTMNCRDILTRSEINKAEAPTASPGVLSADITAGATSFSVSEALASDYDASGTIRISEEVMTYSSFTDNGDGTLTFTISARGTDGTTAATHSADDTVQLCLRYTAQRVDTILADLLGKYANIEYQYLDIAGWESEVDSHLVAYSLTTLITDHHPVKELIGELSQQAMFSLWWDDRAQKVKIAAVRGQTSEPSSLTDSANIIEGSVTLRERPEQRADQVWVHFNQRNPTEDVAEDTNYNNVIVFVRGAGYRQPQVRKLYSRWLASSAQANQTASRIARRFQDVPLEMTFEMDAKDRSVWVADTYYIEHRRLVDKNGRPVTDRIFTIVEAAEDVMAGRVRYVAIDATLAGFIYVVVDDAEGDYVGDGSDQFNGAWISDSQGLYGNGDQGARIS